MVGRDRKRGVEVGRGGQFLSLRVAYIPNLSLLQMPTFTVIFVQATFVLATFFHIRNISTVTNSILTKLKGKIPGTIFHRCQLSQCHLYRQHFSWQHLSISGISQLLLALFWPNFKGRFLGDRLEQIPTVMVTFVRATFLLATFVHISHISRQGQGKVKASSRWD